MPEMHDSFEFAISRNESNPFEWNIIYYMKAYLVIEGFVNPVKILKALFPVSRVGSLKWYYII